MRALAAVSWRARTFTDTLTLVLEGRTSGLGALLLSPFVGANEYRQGVDKDLRSKETLLVGTVTVDRKIRRPHAHLGVSTLTSGCESTGAWHLVGDVGRNRECDVHRVPAQPRMSLFSFAALLEPIETIYFPLHVPASSLPQEIILAIFCSLQPRSVT